MHQGGEIHHRTVCKLGWAQAFDAQNQAVALRQLVLQAGQGVGVALKQDHAQFGQGVALGWRAGAHICLHRGWQRVQKGGERAVGARRFDEGEVARGERGGDVMHQTQHRLRYAPNSATAGQKPVAVGFSRRPRQGVNRADRAVGEIVFARSLRARRVLVIQIHGVILHGGQQIAQRGEACRFWGDLAALGGCCREVGGQRAVGLRQRLHQPVQIERAAGLGAGARAAHAAEGLHADHGADEVAVDVHIAGVNALAQLGNGFVDATVYAEGQAVAGGVDGVEHRAELLAPVAQHMQHRAEHLALQAVDGVELDQRGTNKGAQPAAFIAPQPGDAKASGLHAGDMGFQVVAGLGIDDGAEVGVHAVGVAQAPVVHRVSDHADHPVGHIFLNAQQTQGRAALTGRIEGRGQHVGDQLLGQCGRVGNERVLPAGLGDQHNAAALRAEALRHGARNQLRHFGGAGEHHPGHRRMRHQRRAHRAAVSGNELHRIGRHAGRVQRVH